MTSLIPPTDSDEGFASEERGQLRHVPLDGAQVGALHEALLDAFTIPELKRLLLFELSADLDQIAPEDRGDARETAYAVVRWAVRKQDIGLLNLLAAALKANPRNPSLIELHNKWQDVVFDPPRCPYPGLNQYKREDSDRFFGREDETLQALDKLRRHPVLAVIGPSGSGKSSLLAASIVPELLRSSFFPDTTWTVKEMRPGGQPMSTLAALLPLPRAGEGNVSQAADASNQRLLLVIDQYEELFTLSGEKERAAFEQELLKYAGRPSTMLVIAVRADFYNDLMVSRLWGSVEDHRLEIVPLRGDKLRRAIEQPANDAMVELEPALVERLLADANDEPGMLPFVQETLVMLWAHAKYLRIERDAYLNLVGDRSGRSGLQVALAEHAEHVYNVVLAGDGERSVARRILLRLIQFGEGRADTRRQQTVEQLRSHTDPAVLEAVLTKLTDRRLTTMDHQDRRVDLSHEALIAGWPRLQDWISSLKQPELTRRRLEDKAVERNRLRRRKDDAGLLDRVELEEAEAWVLSEDAAILGVSDEIRALIVDSRIAVNQSSRRWRTLAIAAVVGLIAAIAAAAIAFWQFQLAEERRVVAEEQTALAVTAEATAEANAAEARRQEESANRASTLALARQLGAQSRAAVARGMDPQLSILLAVQSAKFFESLGVPPDQETDAALRSALDAAPNSIYAVGPGWQGSTTTLDTMNLTSFVGFSPSGRYLMYSGNDPSVLPNVGIIDLQTGAPLQNLDIPDTVTSAELDGSESTLRITTAPGDVYDYDLQQQQLRQTAPPGPPVEDDHRYLPPLFDSFWRDPQPQPTADVVMSGTELYLTVEQSITAGISQVVTVTAPSDFAMYPFVSFAQYTPSGDRLIVVGTSDAMRPSAVYIWNMVDGSNITDAPLLGSIMQAALSSDGAYALALSSADPELLKPGTAYLWETQSGKEVAALRHTQIGGIFDAAFSPDGRSFATLGLDGTVRVWDVPNQKSVPAASTAASAPGDVDPFAVTTTDARREGNSVYVTDPDTGSTLDYVFENPTWGLSASGDLLAADTAGAALSVWNLASGEKLLDLPDAFGGAEGGYNIHFSRDGSRIIGVGDAEHIRVWSLDAGPGPAVRTFDPPPFLWSLVENNDASILVYLGRVGFARRGEVFAEILDVDDDQVHDLNGVTNAAFSPDEKYIALSNIDGTARVVETEKMGIVAELPHEAEVLATVFSPDGELLATAASDGTVRIWNWQDSQLQSVFQFPYQPEEGYASLQFSPDGSLLSSGGEYQWQVKTADLIDRACRILARNFTVKEWETYIGERYPYQNTCADAPV